MIRERAEMLEQTQNNGVDQSPVPSTLQSPVDAIAQSVPPSNAVPAGRAPLFVDNELSDFRRRWQDVQGSFVDDPRSAVHRADELVGSVMNRLTEVFTREREKMEHEWDRGEDVSTEDLRIAIQRYRSFFDRLLSL
jgi:hypothetical protein